MKNKIAHIVMTPFTGLGDFNPDNKWLLWRIRFFKRFCQERLVRQKGIESFWHLLTFRKEDEQNPIIANFCSDLSFVPLFSGLLFWDDRFVAQSEKNRRLVDRLGSLKSIEKNYRNYDWIYFTRLDSDDFFATTALKEIQEQRPKEKTAFIFQNGYIYNETTNEMAEYNPDTCPPFYTICFPKNVFFNPQKHLEYMKGWKSHEDTVKVFKPVYMSDRKYCVGIHGNNTSTTWDHRFRGKLVDNNLIKDFI